MKANVLGLFLALTLLSSSFAQAQNNSTQDFDRVPAPIASNEQLDTDALDELDPYDPNVEQNLQMLDWLYEIQTGEKANIDDGNPHLFATCYRQTCPVWIQVDKSSQTAWLYLNGNPQYTWRVSTGVEGHGTPNFDRNPNGRIYDAHTSSKYPGGDYNGLGNMPYAVFIEGGFAIHGTGRSNWGKLGRRASHGCIRLHPDNAFIFNRLVRQYGIYKTWITVQ